MGALGVGTATLGHSRVLSRTLGYHLVLSRTLSYSRVPSRTLSYSRVPSGTLSGHKPCAALLRSTSRRPAARAKRYAQADEPYPLDPNPDAVATRQRVAAQWVTRQHRETRCNAVRAERACLRRRPASSCTVLFSTAAPRGRCTRLPTMRCLPHLHRDCAHLCHICTGTALTPAASVPGLGSPLPHLHRDCAHPCRICTWTGLTPATSAPGLGASLPHPHRNWAHPCHVCTGPGRTSALHRDWAHPATGLTPSRA